MKLQRHTATFDYYSPIAMTEARLSKYYEIIVYTSGIEDITPTGSFAGRDNKRAWLRVEIDCRYFTEKRLLQFLGKVFNRLQKH